MKAEISVIIPLYNKEKDISKTLESLFAQNFNNFEVILVNDGSTDGSDRVVRTFTDRRIRYFSKENEGVAKTRNFAVQQANTPYVAFLDADDYWFPHHLDNLYAAIVTYPEAKWFAKAYAKKHNALLTTTMISPVMTKKNWCGWVEDYFANSLTDALAWTSAVCMRRDFFLKLGGFNAAITNGAGEDTDLWVRAALEAPLVFCTKVSAIHHLDSSNRISLIPTKDREFMNLDAYEKAAQNNKSLKKYLDINRFSLALQHKMAGDAEAFQKYTQKIDLNNLTRQQRFLLKQNSQTLFLFKKLKRYAERFGKRLSLYKR